MNKTDMKTEVTSIVDTCKLQLQSELEDAQRELLHIFKTRVSVIPADEALKIASCMELNANILDNQYAGIDNLEFRLRMSSDTIAEFAITEGKND